MNRSEFNAINASAHRAKGQCVREIELAITHLSAAKSDLELIPTEAAYAKLLYAGVLHANRRGGRWMVPAIRERASEARGGMMHNYKDVEKYKPGFAVMEIGSKWPAIVFMDEHEAWRYSGQLNDFEAQGKPRYYVTIVDVCLDGWEPPRQTCFYVRDHQGVAGNWFSKCSNCGTEFDERVVRDHFIYCPACGAKLVEQG